MSAYVLVVDDEEQMRRALKSILTTHDYEVELAHGGREAIERAVQRPPQLIILDLAMPEMDGFEVCRQLRTWLQAPILVLSVRADAVDKIKALDLGADDYLNKPFVAGELLARVRALLRRPPGIAAADAVVEVENLSVDIARRRVSVDGEEIKLTKTEFDILAYLAKNSDRVLTSRMILENVWGPEYRDDVHTLRVHIANLRRKIEPDAAVPRFIVTEPGIGYSLSTS